MKKIVLVEDNPDHAELVLRSINNFVPRETIKYFNDGEAAFNYFTDDCAKGEKPDLVLLDLRLPKVDGIEILKQIKDCDLTNAIPVVILTTSESPRDIKKAYEMCANAYVVKPESYEEYEEMVKGMGGFWLKLNRTLS